jgi:hypothetical protein
MRYFIWDKKPDPHVSGPGGRITMARMMLALAVCGMAFAASPAAAQNEGTETPPSPSPPAEAAPAPALPLVPPAPHDAPVAQMPAPKDKPLADGKAAEAPVADSKPSDAAPAAEGKPVENTEGRYTFSRMQDGYLRLDNRTGQVSFCSKRTVGWTCQLAPEDRGVLENEIARVQEENATLKKELLTRGLPLPGAMKPEPPVAHNDRTFSLPTDPNLDRMKVLVEKVWRRLVDMITTLQKDVLKKS